MPPSAARWRNSAAGERGCVDRRCVEAWRSLQFMAFIRLVTASSRFSSTFAVIV